MISYKGKLIRKDRVVKVNNRPVLKVKCHVCPECQDYYLRSDQYIVGDKTFCSYSCLKESRMEEDVYGELTSLPEVLHQGFAPKYSTTRVHKANQKDPFLIGLEIEKEDVNHYTELKQYGLKLPEEWICVKDTSLKTGYGFEIISPAYNLSLERKRLFKELKKFENLIDSEVTGSCGGHISVSKYETTGKELAHIHRPMICFFLAMFPARMNNRNIHMYNYAQCNEYGEGMKHKPFQTVGDRFELRMITAVQSRKQLVRRIKTIEWFLHNEPSFGMTYREINNKEGFLRKNFSSVYGPEKWDSFVKRYCKMSLWFCQGRHELQVQRYMNMGETD